MTKAKAIESMTSDDLKKIYGMYAAETGYLETPPSIMDFINNDYYIGGATGGGTTIYPYWKEILRDIYPTPFFEHNKYKALIYSGSTGIGKSTIASIVFLYDLARILCLDNPQKTFNLPNSTKIIFMLTNSTIDNAESINLDPIMAIIRTSPFFISKFNIKTKTNMFFNNIDIDLCSRKRQLVGKNILAAISDEINQTVIKGGSHELVTEMYNRINSRFLLPGSKWPGHYNLISSATEESSLIQSIMDNAADKDKTDVKIIGAPRYVVKGHLNIYSGDKFEVFIGDYQSDPFMIRTKADKLRAVKLDSSKIVEVPVEHKDEFDDIWAGIRDVIGLPISSTRTFIPQKDKINEALQITPLSKDELIISSEDDIKLIDMFNKDIIDSFKPGSQKIIGIDVGLTNDRLGLAMSHTHSLMSKERHTEDGLESMSENVYWVDFAVGIKCPKGQQVPLWKIREFFVDLKRLGVNIALIVCDTYQSYDMVQQLKRQGFNAEMHSVDRKKDAYHFFRNLIIDGRIKMPHNEILFKELTYLQENEKKIDHPMYNPDGTVGTKDICDAICTAVFLNDKKFDYNPMEDRDFRQALVGEESGVESIFGHDVQYENVEDLFQ